MRFFLPLSVVALWSAQSGHAFQLPRSTTMPQYSSEVASTALYASEENDNDNNNMPQSRRTRLARKVKKSLAFLAPVALVGSSALLVAPEQAHAGAPVVAMPKQKPQDPIQQAFDRQEQIDMMEAQKELSAFQAKARAIEKESGAAARDTFEKEYKENQRQQANEKMEGLKQLKRDLLDQGIDPSLDIEGTRQVILYTRGVDLGTISGTKYNVEQRYQESGSKQAFAVQKKAHREMIKAMVQDLKNQGKDPLVYFEIHTDKTDMILNLPEARAEALAAKYNENLELYGQIAVPKEGEKSAKELMAEKGIDASGNNKAEAKAKAAAEKAAAKAAKAAEKAAAKAEKAAEKAAAKAEKAAEKEAAKAEKEAAKVAAAAAAAASAAAAAAVPEAPVMDASPETTDSDVVVEEIVDESSAVAEVSEGKKSSGGIDVVKASAVVVTLGGGAFAFKMVQDKAAAAEEERQRQFKMLMGDAASDAIDVSAGEAVADLMSGFEEDDDVDDDDEEPVVDTPKPKKKKKRRGLKSLIGKKKNDRETNIENLVEPGAPAAEFSKTLAKILTFGAPGRFPDVTSLPGAMPIETFELEAASAVLMQAQETAGLSKEESAEIFANVVNCMLIDIVDLASTSLKEKDQKVTTDAIGIVISFMDLAASLYTSIADGVEIVPVTYGGDISKGKLEQMYSTYALSGMTDMSNMDDKFDNRVSLLQDVFQINAKKAEGLMMKAMQKNMMEMMKSGKMPDGMEEMMQGMDDMGGMGLPGMDGEEPDPEQLKEMLRALKDLKDSGALPESELKEVRKQFKEAFGSSIDEVMKGADEAGGDLGEQDKELLDLMKDILE